MKRLYPIKNVYHFFCQKMSNIVILCTKEEPPFLGVLSSILVQLTQVYPEPDLNRHGLFSQRILSPSCLPIPSPGQLLFNSRTRPADPSPNSQWDVDWRRRPDSNRRMAVLQTDPLDHLGTTPYCRFFSTNSS